MFLSHLLWGKFIHPFSPIEGKGEKKKIGRKSKEIARKAAKKDTEFSS